MTDNILKFSDMWRLHPSNNGELMPCSKSEGGQPYFANQCAIRFGVCLDSSGFDMSDYSGVKCWFHKNSNHTLRVEELVSFLEKKLPKNILKISNRKRGKVISPEPFFGKTGIIAFLNFWGESKQGDHIDLWNIDEMSYGDLDYFERSESVYFWEIR